MIFTEKPEDEIDFKVFDRNLVIAFSLAAVLIIAVGILTYCFAV